MLSRQSYHVCTVQNILQKYIFGQRENNAKEGTNTNTEIKDKLWNKYPYKK
jgi:hypothetical protein